MDFSVVDAISDLGTSKRILIDLRLPSDMLASGSERFYKILSELALLHAKKQADYGKPNDPFSNVRASEGFGVPGWVGCMMRANDKMVRIQKAAQGGKLANEALEDSLRDLAVYAVIGLCLFEEEQDAQREKLAKQYEQVAEELRHAEVVIDADLDKEVDRIFDNLTNQGHPDVVVGTLTDGEDWKQERAWK